MAINPEDLFLTLQWNYNVIMQQADGVSHEESVRTPAYPVNTFNWVVGHIIVHRDYMLELLGAPQLMNPREQQAYGYGSQPIHGKTPALPFDTLIRLFQQSQQALDDALSQVPMSIFDEADGDRTVGSRLRSLVWHETYHAGQTEYTRQIAGKNDKVI